MSEEFFYHYTDAESAQHIFLSGYIRPSVPSPRDAVHGAGVYLTTLEPRLGREVVAYNNWGGTFTGQTDKMECYFELWLPSHEVKRAKDERDIQIYVGPLFLRNYKWNLKRWDGELLATQHFMIRSEGEAAEDHDYLMGRYTLYEYIVSQDGLPVYKKDDGNFFLYTDKNGNWCVGDVVGDNRCWLSQDSNKSPSPDRTEVWKYIYEDTWSEDITLKVHACY